MDFHQVKEQRRFL